MNPFAVPYPVLIRSFSKALLLFGLLITLMLPLPGLTQEALLEFKTPEEERIYQTLIKELRCLVCQNQNLADSNAGLAQDLRKKTYEMVSEGKNRDEIADYMVERYGEFVLYRPSVSGTNLILWVSPFILLVLLIALTIRFVYRSKRPPQQTSSDSSDTAEHSIAPYSEEQLSKAKSLIKEKS